MWNAMIYLSLFLFFTCLDSAETLNKTRIERCKKKLKRHFRSGAWNDNVVAYKGCGTLHLSWKNANRQINETFAKSTLVVNCKNATRGAHFFFAQQPIRRFVHSYAEAAMRMKMDNVVPQNPIQMFDAATSCRRSPFWPRNQTTGDHRSAFGHFGYQVNQVEIAHLRSAHVEVVCIPLIHLNQAMREIFGVTMVDSTDHDASKQKFQRDARQALANPAFRRRVVLWYDYDQTFYRDCKKNFRFVLVEYGKRVYKRPRSGLRRTPSRA